MPTVAVSKPSLPKERTPHQQCIIDIDDYKTKWREIGQQYYGGAKATDVLKKIIAVEEKLKKTIERCDGVLDPKLIEAAKEALEAVRRMKRKVQRQIGDERLETVASGIDDIYAAAAVAIAAFLAWGARQFIPQLN